MFRSLRWARPARRLLLVALTGLATAAAAGQEVPSEGAGGAGRVLLVGIDGASPRVTEPLLQRGLLPNLARIARKGVHGPLQSNLPLLSPAIWTTIATGKLRQKHGIDGFVGHDERRLLLASDRKVPAIWEIASARGRSASVVNWWMTYPPDPLDGVVVSDHFFPKSRQLLGKVFGVDAAEASASTGTVYPASFERSARMAAWAGKPLSDLRNPFEPGNGLAPWVDREFLAERWRDDQAIARVGLLVERRQSPDLLLVYIPGLDSVSHWLWGSFERGQLYPERLRPTPAQREAGRLALVTYYRYVDALIGKLLSGYGEDDLVVVVSDHGFEAGVEFSYLTGTHRSEAASRGILFARGPGIEPGAELGPVSVTQIAPSVLAWMGLPVARDMDGTPASFLDVTASTIASYGKGTRPRRPRARSGAEEAILRRLERLGYIESSAPAE